jgi:protein TonB
MTLTDITEYIPEPPPHAPPPPMQEIIPQVESIAETMIEADIIPEQIIVEPGSLITVPEITHSDDPWVGYISQSQISVLPQFNINEITADLIYPQIALRSGIEGRVILELFVDRTGVIQRIDILREEPAGRGFGDAAISAFTGRKGEPAYSNGLAVSCRYRYPVTFRIR